MIGVLFSIAALADSPEFQPVIQIRPRFETHTGRDGIEGGDAAFVAQRTRIGGTLIQGPLSARVVVQDVRIWGEEAHTLFDYQADGLDLHSGHFVWKPSESAELIVGRQSIAIHEHRLVGTVGWTPQARAFDGGVFKWGSDTWSADLAGLMVANVNTAMGYDATLGILRAGRSDDNTTIDLLYLPLHDGSRDRLSHTGGLYAKAKTGVFSARAEAYVQAGTRDGLNELAWMGGIASTIAPDTGGSPKITLWYDHLSGDATPGDGTAQAFDTLFDTRHKFYGLIDVMNFGMAGAADGRGLQDAALKLAGSPADGVGVGVDAHLFLPSAAQNGPSVLGQEVDVTSKFKLTPGLSAAVGGAVLLRTDLEPDLWSFVQLDAALK
jgi:hypothetical protein